MPKEILFYVALIASYLIAIGVGYILGYHSPRAPYFGTINVEKSKDPAEQNDKISFVFAKDLDELYSAKLIKLSVVHTERERNNSDNDEN